MLKFKRFISGLVGVAMAASMFTSMPFSVFAEDETETNNQTYVHDDYEVSYQVTNSWAIRKWYPSLCPIRVTVQLRIGCCISIQMEKYSIRPIVSS